jgi:hypothetical protein
MYLKDFDVKISGSHKIKVSTKAWIIRISMLIIVSFLVAYRLYQGAIFHNPSVIGSTIMPTISILMLIGEDDDIAAAVLSIRQMLALLFFSVCRFYTLVKVPYLQPVHSKNLSIIQGLYSVDVCIFRLHGLKYKEKTNIFK